MCTASAGPIGAKLRNWRLGRIPKRASADRIGPLSGLKSVRTPYLELFLSVTYKNLKFDFILA